MSSNLPLQKMYYKLHCARRLPFSLLGTSQIERLYSVIFATMADDKAAEVTPEPVANEVAEVKSETETKEEKTPETPVTEPITNGSNTPESPKVEIPAAEEAAPVASPESDKTETEAKPEPEPEQLPVNGLSLEETKGDETETPKVEEESKADESPAETTETAPAIEIPVKKEEPLPVSDKLADLIPEVPVVPELKTEAAQETAVARAD